MKPSISNEKYWVLTADTLLADIESTSDRLASSVARTRLINFGYNTLETKEVVGQFRLSDAV
jgi:hypothetical protein